MAHLVESMAYAGEVPWHGLGTKVDSNISVDGMLEKAGLNWNVKKVPLFMDCPDGTRHMHSKMALVREKDGFMDELSTVSQNWNPVQNQEAFELFEPFVRAGSLEMHTAGSLKGGRIVWGLAKMKDSFVLHNDDVTDNFLLLVNPHTFGARVHVRSTPIRVVCNNTLSLSINQVAKAEAYQTHKKPFDLEEMVEAMNMCTEEFKSYRDAANFISSIQYTDKKVKEYFDKVFPTFSKTETKSSKLAQKCFEVLETQPGSEYGRHTWWQAFNAVTFISDHKANVDVDRRITSTWFGQNSKRKQKALDLAVKYAEVAL